MLMSATDAGANTLFDVSTANSVCGTTVRPVLNDSHRARFDAALSFSEEQINASEITHGSTALTV